MIVHSPKYFLLSLEVALAYSVHGDVTRPSPFPPFPLAPLSALIHLPHANPASPTPNSLIIHSPSLTLPITPQHSLPFTSPLTPTRLPSTPTHSHTSPIHSHSLSTFLHHISSLHIPFSPLVPSHALISPPCTPPPHSSPPLSLHIISHPQTPSILLNPPQSSIFNPPQSSSILINPPCLICSPTPPSPLYPLLPTLSTTQYTLSITQSPHSHFSFTFFLFRHEILFSSPFNLLLTLFYCRISFCN
jgi:hypothetical protein